MPSLFYKKSDMLNRSLLKYSCLEKIGRLLERLLVDNAKSSCVCSSAGGETVVLTSP